MYNITISVSLSICSQSWNWTVPISYPARKSFFHPSAFICFSSKRKLAGNCLLRKSFSRCQLFPPLCQVSVCITVNPAPVDGIPCCCRCFPLPPKLGAQVAAAFPSFQAWWKNYDSFIVLPVTWARRRSLTEFLVNVKSKQANKQHFTVLVLSMLERR